MKLGQFLDADFIVARYSSGKVSTQGVLFMRTVEGELLWLCHTLEDAHPDIDLGKGRIPPGRYPLELKRGGGYHARYDRRFPAFHKGMIHVRGVPGFVNILWHIGNSAQDTAGCLLLAWQQTENIERLGFSGRSTDAYIFAYKQAIAQMEQRKCFVRYIDIA